mmetsp:Transcript_6680/g.7622  ORF Transcript_6680/g.7622 Transcript_6680/m.7622 type:complete len:86 (-) Transcript_6680:29-286(-)
MKKKSYKDIDGLTPQKTESIKCRITSNPKIRSNVKDKFLNYLAKKGVNVDPDSDLLKPSVLKKAALSTGFKQLPDNYLNHLRNSS